MPAEPEPGRAEPEPVEPGRAEPGRAAPEPGRVGPAGGTAGVVAIGVVSLNVCGLPSALPPATRRAAEFCRRIEASGAEVANLQEVWSYRLLRFIRARLPSYGWVGWRPGLAGPAGGLVTFSRLPLGAASFTPFRGTRPDAGSAVFRGVKVVNGRLKGVLTTDLAGRRTAIANVHLSANRDGDWSTGNRHHGYQRAQLAALHEILRRTRPAGTEVAILSGDFNLPSTASLAPLVTDHGSWRDPFAAADQPTFHHELLPPGRTPHRIDYLLVAGDPDRYPATGATLLFTEPVPLARGGPAFLSDHAGLTARVAIPS
ncbi:MAG: hypothetical protein V7637_4466 [Mycobacteriales bacterium]